MRSAPGLLILAACFSFAAAGPIAAQDVILRTPDGMTYTYNDLGNGFALRSDPHGPVGVLPAPEPPRPPTPAVPDLRRPGSALRPVPPSNLTPAPVLPYTPHGTIIPHERPSPAVPLAPNPPFMPSGPDRGVR